MQFTRINIEVIILRKKIEDLRDAGGNVATRRQWGQLWSRSAHPELRPRGMGGTKARYRLKFAGVSAARIASTIAAGGRIVSTFRIGRAM